MKILGFFGSQPRHLYVLDSLLRSGLDIRSVIMKRESILPKAPDGLSARDRANFAMHFEGRRDHEERQFGQPSLKALIANTEHLLISPPELNSDRVREFVRERPVEKCVIFGTDIIDDSVLSLLPSRTLNMHLGLSPRYRGSATLFWPFYFLEPQFCGVTFHKPIKEPDAGAVLHQFRTPLIWGDGIHDVGTRSVEEGTRILRDLLWMESEKWKFTRQGSSGRNFLSRDFKPHHLRVIYDLFEDRIVDEYLQGNLPSSLPQLLIHPDLLPLS